MKMPTMPKPNGIRPMTVTIHCDLDELVELCRNDETYVNGFISRPAVPEECYWKTASEEYTSWKTHLRLEYAWNTISWVSITSKG